MTKRTTGFYLDDSSIKWLEEKAKQEGRSTSNYLDRMIALAMQNEEIANEVEE